MTRDELHALWIYICGMMSNGCCPCEEWLCDCFGGVPFTAAEDIVNWVVTFPESSLAASEEAVDEGREG